MPTPKDEEIKVRVPAALKTAFGAIADSRYTSISEVAREALLDYLARHNMELREKPAPYGKPAPAPSSARRQALEAEALDIVKRSVKKKVAPPGPK